MTIKGKINDKAQDLTDTMAMQARAKFIDRIMKDEKCDYAMAMAIVEGRTDPIEYEYMLGYKLASPVVMLAIFKQRSKEKRRQAAENFAMTLSEPEKKIFYEQVFNEETGKKFKNEYKKQKDCKGQEM